jgi:hypothetical protein
MYLAKYAPDGKLLWVTANTCDYQIVAYSMDTDASGNIYLTGNFGHHNLNGSAVFGRNTLKTFGGRDIFIIKYNPNGVLEWVKQAGSSLDSVGTDCGMSLASSGNGDFVVTGWFKGDAKFDQAMLSGRGDRDIFLTKYSGKGDLKWVLGFGGAADDRGYAVCLDKEGNSYCTGFFTGKALFGSDTLVSKGPEDVFVLKCDPYGRLLWVRQFGGDGPDSYADSAQDIFVDSKGRLVVTGFFSGTMDINGKTLTSAGKEDIFLLFFDIKNGVVQDVKQIAPLQATRLELPDRKTDH